MSVRALRLQHYQGERLRAADLRDDNDELTTFRALHIRTLHDAWGIALGLDVYLVAGTTFSVNPGLAYDRLGRELLLPAAQSTPALDADAGDGIYDLVLTLAASGQPQIRWQPETTTHLGVDVPLLAVQIADGALASVDFSIRRYAQPLARPHIGYGLTAVEQRWKLWSKAGGERKVGFGVRVDTTSAGFVGTPLYVASLQLSGNALFVGQPNAGQVQMYLFTSIANATSSGFTFRVVVGGEPPVPSESHQSPPDVHGIYQRFVGGNFPFRVAWMGVEPNDVIATSGLEGIA
jgi:hypothetical protein